MGFLIATPEVTAGPQVIGRSFSSAWDHFQEGPQKSSIMTSACTRGCEIFAPGGVHLSPDVVNLPGTSCM